MRKIGYGITDSSPVRVMYKDYELPYIEKYCSGIVSTAKELGVQRHRCATVIGEQFMLQFYTENILPHLISQMQKCGAFRSMDASSGKLWSLFYAMSFESDEAKEAFREFLQAEAVRLSKYFSKTNLTHQEYS